MTSVGTKICLVGGIFDREEKVRSKHVITPETVLLDGFRKADVAVDAVGHARFLPSDGYDIIHVHHFGKAALGQIGLAAGPVEDALEEGSGGT